MRVYAVGDLHGRHDLLRAIETRILEDAVRQPFALQMFLVYVGDYVDRGFQSRQVLDHFCADSSLEGIPRILLRGNHDLWMQAFLEGEPVGESWLRFGGDATLASYGVRLNPKLPAAERFAEAREAFLERMPEAHRKLLDELETAFSLGDYFFCHAGIRPGVPLAAQQESDLFWIREPFLSWTGEPEKIVVHGHTVSETPVVRRNRIGIDTGACFTGTLTCLVLEGSAFRFLSVAGG